MTTNLAYPASLPGPMSMPQQRADRRASTGLSGPRALRALWRDKLDPSVPVTFRFGTPEQAEAFTDWLHILQADGGAWFAANWRLPQGRGGVFRFVQVPGFPQWLAPNVWECSGTVEIRGRSLLPIRQDEWFLDIDAQINGGSLPSVGKTINGLDAIRTYYIDIVQGLYTAWEQHEGANNWSVSHSMNTSHGEIHHDPGVTYPNALAAFQSFTPYTVTNTTFITLYIFDSPVDDNVGGLSFRVRG